MTTCSSPTGAAIRTRRLRDAGPTIAELFCRAAQRGVIVKGLMWRSHLDKFAYSEEENRHLGDAIEAAGGEVLLDQRVRFGGSHHQKLVVLRHPGRSRTGRRIRRRHRPVPFPARRRVAPRRPAGGADGGSLRRSSTVARRATAAAGPGGRCARRHVPGTLERPGPAGHAVADRVDPGQVARRRSRARRVARSATRSAAVRTARGTGAAHLSGRAFRIRLRAARRAQHRPRVQQGAARGPAG